MKTKLLGVIVGLILFGQLPAYAATTTYQYDGAPYIFSTDPTLGTHMTGNVTFNFDTTGVTGGPFDLSNGVTNIELDSGTYQLTSQNVVMDNFFLRNGSIITWVVEAEGFSGPTFVFLLSDDVTVTPDEATANGIALSNTVGVWSIAGVSTPLPAALPLFATGLGAMGLFGWRRKRKAQAVAA